MNEKILAYDLGTGGNKASLYDKNGKKQASVFVPYKTYYPQNGWHEQRPEAWWEAVVESTRQLKKQSGFDAKEIQVIGISGHSLGCVPLGKDGTVLRRETPIWSDTRASKQTKQFFSRINQTEWYMKTGNGFPPECYPLFKIMWYRDNEPEIFTKTATIIGTKDYINYRLTGKIATDYSYASGSGMYDLIGRKYASDLGDAAGIGAELFPEIIPSTGIVGRLSSDAARACMLSEDTKVVCGGVDNSCMALGAGNIGEGRVYTSLGSSSWIAVSSKDPVLDPKKLPFVFTHVAPGLFTSAVSIFSAGSSFAWVRNVLCKDLEEKAVQSSRDVYDLMAEEAEKSPVGARGLLFNPSLAGGSGQEPSPNIRGAFSGIDLRHTRGDMVRAAMEGIALNLGSALNVLKGFCRLSDEMLIVGGGSRSTLWRQIFADVYEMSVVKTNVDQDAGALGAAALGAVGVGFWDDFTLIDDIHQEQNRKDPDPIRAEQYRRVKTLFSLQQRQSAEFGEAVRTYAADGGGREK